MNATATTDTAYTARQIFDAELEEAILTVTDAVLEQNEIDEDTQPVLHEIVTAAFHRSMEDLKRMVFAQLDAKTI